MEKPSVSEDRYRSQEYNVLRYRDTLPAHSMRMIMSRDVPVLSDRKDEQDASVWRGDHSFSSEAASYSLMNFIEPEVAREHPDWGTDRIKSEARERFTKRLAQDLTYEHKERNHVETTVVWKPHSTSGGDVELATEYGDGYITLRELWEHTREFAEYSGNPEAYNASEARAQLAMQEEFLRGDASQYVSVLSHPDSIRYVQIWEKTTDGAVSSRQLDLHATTGRDFTHREGEVLVRALADVHREPGTEQHADSSGYVHMLMRQRFVQEKHIRMLATAISMQTSRIVPRFSEHRSGDRMDLRMLQDRDVREFVRDVSAGTSGDDAPIYHECIAKEEQTPKRSAEFSPFAQFITDWKEAAVVLMHIKRTPEMSHAALLVMVDLGEAEKTHDRGSRNVTAAGLIHEMPGVSVSGPFQEAGKIDVPADSASEKRTITERVRRAFSGFTEGVTRAMTNIARKSRTFVRHMSALVFSGIRAAEEPQKKAVRQSAPVKMDETIPVNVRLIRVVDRVRMQVRRWLDVLPWFSRHRDTPVQRIYESKTHEPVPHAQGESRDARPAFHSEGQTARDVQSIARAETGLLVWLRFFLSAPDTRGADGQIPEIGREESHAAFLLLAIIRYLVLLHESGMAGSGRSIPASKRPRRKKKHRMRLIFACAS